MRDASHVSAGAFEPDELEARVAFLDRISQEALEAVTRVHGDDPLRHVIARFYLLKSLNQLGAAVPWYELDDLHVTQEDIDDEIARRIPGRRMDRIGQQLTVDEALAADRRALTVMVAWNERNARNREAST